MEEMINDIPLSMKEMGISENRGQLKVENEGDVDLRSKKQLGTEMRETGEQWCLPIYGGTASQMIDMLSLVCVRERDR